MSEKRRRFWRRSRRKILYVLASCILIAGLLSVNSCSQYDPALYPVTDVLVPGGEVEIVGFQDGNVIVTPEYIIWVEDLKIEIIRLRKLLEKK